MTPARPPNKYAPYVFFCWLYIGLGIGSMAVGAYLLAFPQLFTGPTVASDPLQAIIAVILIVFGIIRIAVAAYNLRRPARRPK